MRALFPILPCVVVLFGFSGAFADPSIVADLDSNATNGPDSLKVEPGDTVLESAGSDVGAQGSREGSEVRSVERDDQEE
ncbi:MAG: hypothetical protein FJY73_13315 [Candidatus Eisenbacteria bacterium]|nr:hypothetical protein [Candidatus Eisenbacteria bacterium]